MQRVLEPELMDEAEQAVAYAAADFSEPNAAFVTRASGLGVCEIARAVDLGCGPADIPVRLATAKPGWRIDAVDGAEAMLAHGRHLVAARGLGSRISLLQACLPDLPLEAHAYDLVLSNSLLHHLHDPDVLWQCVRQLGKPGAHVLVMDLMRPESLEAVERLVALYAAEAPPVLRRDFHASLCAAFTPAEVEAQLAAAGLVELTVERASDRHLLAVGQLAG